MLKAYNNHFGGRSKIKIPKIRPFVNLKSAKIAKKCKKKFSVNFGRNDMHKTFKKSHQINAFDLIFHLV